MRTSTAEKISWPAIMKLSFTDTEMHVFLSDGRTVIVPLAWYPSLVNATKAQLENYRIMPTGYGVHWPDLDEDLSIKGFLIPPAERQPK